MTLGDVSEGDDTLDVIAGMPLDLGAASFDARTLLLVEAAHDAAALVAGGRLPGEQATAYLLRYAEQLRLYGPNAANGLDASELIASCLTTASKPWADLPLPNLDDPATWGGLHEELLRVSGRHKPATVREIRPGVRASESFVSVTMAQATLHWLAKTAPAGQPWMSLVLVLGELEERRDECAKLRAELEAAQRAIRQTSARIAELNGD